MALIVADRVQETTNSTGTGALSLLGAVSGYRAFDDVCANNDQVYYAVWAVDGNGNPSGAWECGLGTFTDTDTLTRTAPAASSNGGAAVNFAAGTKYVILSATAGYLQTLATGALDGLTDVDTTGVSDGDVLTYDSGSWVPAAPSGGSAWGGWTELTFGSTSTVLGMTNCNVANETLTAANGDRIEIEAEVEKAVNTDGACGIRVGSEGYYLKAQQDNNLVSYRYDGGSEIAFNATGNSIPNDYSGVYTYKLVVNVDSALSNILYGMINDLRFPTTSHTSDPNVNCTGTVEFFVRGSSIKRVRARIIT